MPFKSKAQQGFMFAKHPAIAKRWAKEYGVPKNLPEHATMALAKGKHKRGNSPQPYGATGGTDRSNTTQPDRS